MNILTREIQLAVRAKAEVINPMIFMLIVLTLFPIAVGGEPNLLAKIAPGIIWVAVLLSSLLGLDRLFRDDYFDGTLEQMALSPKGLFFVAFMKGLSHWLISGLPLLLLTPIAGLLLNFRGPAFDALWLTLLIGTPILSFIGSVGAALTVSLRKGSLLSSILILPFFIPIIIFSTAAVDAASLSLPYNAQLAWLGAMLVMTLPLAPLATAAAIKLNVN